MAHQTSKTQWTLGARCAVWESRGADWQCFVRRWEAAQAGEGGAIWIEGDEGFGKSFFLQRCMSHAENVRGVVSFLIQGCQVFRDFPYAPFIKAFRPLKHKRRRSVKRGAELFSAFLASEHGGKQTHLQELQCCEAVQEYIAWLQQEHVVLLCVDDAHCLDGASLRLLLYLATSLQDQRVLVVCVGSRQAGREVYAQWVRAYTELATTSTLQLRAFGEEDLAVLLQQRLGHEVTKQLCDFLLTQTGGHPLLLHTLLEWLIERESLFFDGYVWHLLVRALTVWPTFPLSLELCRLSADALSCLWWLALDEWPTPHRWLLLCMDDDVDSIECAVRAVYERGWLAQQDTTEDVLYVWQSPWARHALYEQMSPLQKRQKHVFFARLLEERAPEETIRLATHYHGSGHWIAHESVAKTLQRAGDQLSQRGELKRAFSYYKLASTFPQQAPKQRALLLEQIAELHLLFGEQEVGMKALHSSLQLYESCDDAVGQARLLRRLAHCQWSALAFQQALETNRVGLSRLPRSARHSREWEDLIADQMVFLDRIDDISSLRQLLQSLHHEYDEHSETFQIVYGVHEVGIFVRKGDFDNALARCDTLLTLAKQIDHLEYIIRLQNFAVLLSFAVGTHEEGERFFRENIARIRTLGRLSDEPAVLGVGGVIAFQAGDWERALQRTKQGLQLAVQTGSLRYQVRLCALCAMIYALQGDDAQARDYLDRASSILGVCTDDVHMAASYWIGEASCALIWQRPQKALDALRFFRLEDQLPQFDITLSTLGMQCWLQSHEQLGEDEPIRAMLAAFECAGLYSDYHRAWGAMIEAQCLHKTGALTCARQRIESAIDTFTTLSIPFDLGRALLVWLSLASVEQASSPLLLERSRLCVRLFESCGASVHQKRAWAYLSDLGLDETILFPPAPTLSKRELAVAKLVAQGHKNEEIAEALFISVHTVRSHLKRMYRRFGLRSRVALAKLYRDEFESSGDHGRTS
tara:strand:+ start:20638 stop:23580 length:2943 start_codon:yes stop_codon:yes gene_type:complete